MLTRLLLALPRLTKPPAGVHGHPMWDSWHDLKPIGYTQHEYFVSGTARAADGCAEPRIEPSAVVGC